MAKILSGKAVADALCANIAVRVDQLWDKGVMPTLALVRVGEDPSDLNYEAGILKRAERIGVAVRRVILPETAEKAAIFSAIDMLNADDAVHGVLLFRPLPPHLKAEGTEIYGRLDPKKDVDGMTPLSRAGVYSGRGDLGYPPCTPAACMELLDHYGYECEGKHAVVLLRQQDKILRLAQGAALGNWTFTGLDAQGAAIFEHNGERRALSVPRPGRELLAPPNH